jgi:hypothetical protein
MSSKILVFTNHLDVSRHRSQQSNSAGSNEVLREMFTLLEEYAPTWYSEDLHNRAVAALRGRTGSLES